MAITYQLTDTAADCGLIAACSGATVLAGGGRKANGGATPGTVEVTANVPSSTTRAVFGIEITPGEAVSWDSGNAVVRLNFTTGHMNVLIQGIHICRVNSSCGSVESLGSETGLGIPTTGGVSIDRTIAISAVASPGEGDKLYIVVVVHNDDSMNSRTVGVTPNGQIDLPWTEEEAPEFSASVVDENPAQGDSAEASSSAPESASAAVADSNPAQVDSAAGRVTVPLVVHAADRKVMGATTAANGITSVDRPDNVSAGDLILIYWLTRNRNQFPDQPPAGFTLLHSFGSTSTTANPWVRFYGKIATASEPASYEVITQEPASFSGLQRIGSERITGHHPNILDVLSGSPTGVTTDDSGPASADIPGIETLHAGCVIYAVGIRRNVNENVSFSPTGWTPTGASIQANHFSAAVGYRFVEDAEQQPDINVSSATGARTTGAMIALRPAGVVEEEGFSGEVTDETPAQGDSAAATQAAPGPQATAGVADENPAQEDSSVGASSPTPPPQATRIRPSPTHPRYWEYDGKTRLFLGATSQDNPFQHPTGLGVENGHNDTLEEHLDRMVAAGGNYIRCTLSTRDHTLPDARLRFPWAWDEGEEAYDLDVWNEDFFERLDWMLGLCEARGIVVGLEFFDAFDWTDSETNAWTLHPMRPANNVNYSTATGVPDTWTATPTNSNQPVFTSVLASNSLNDPELIAGYLEAYVHRVLGVTFQHPNVLYIVSNETSLPAEYSFHFIDLIKARAVADDVDEVHVTEMLNENDLTHASHVVFYDEVPGRVSFHEASQVGHPQGDTRWERLIAQRGLTDDPDRPINVTKVYYRPPPLNSAHPPREATRALWQYVLSGVSVARYHRSATLASTPSGIGLVTESINGIRSVRKVEAVFDLIGAVPAMGLLSDRAADEAYAGEDPEGRVAVFFPNAGSVTVDISGLEGPCYLRWMDVLDGEWASVGVVDGDEEEIELTAPTDSLWVAVLDPVPALAEYRWQEGIDGSGDRRWRLGIGEEAEEHQAGATEQNPAQLDTASASHDGPAPAAAVADQNPAQDDAAAATLAAPAFAAAASDGTPAQVDSATAAHGAPVFSGGTTEHNPSQLDEATGAATAPAFGASAAEQAPPQADAATTAHGAPVFTVTATETNPAQAEATAAGHAAPTFGVVVADQAPAQADASAGSHATPAFTGAAVDQAPAQTDVAEGSHATTVHSGAAVAPNPPQADATTAQHATPAFQAEVVGGNPVQVDAATAGHVAPVFSAAATEATPLQADAATAGHLIPGAVAGTADQTPPQADAATAAHVTPTIIAGVADTTPPQADALTAAHVTPAFAATAAESTPTQADAATAAHATPAATGAVQDANPPQADALTAAHATPAFVATGTDRNPTQEDAAGASVALAFQAIAVDTTPPQADAAGASFTVLTFPAAAQDATPPQADASAGSHATPVSAGAGQDGTPAQVDSATAAATAPEFGANAAEQNPTQTDAAAGAWLAQLHLATATDATPAQADVATGTGTVPAFQASSVDLNPAQGDAAGTTHAAPTATGAAMEANPPQADAATGAAQGPAASAAAQDATPAQADAAMAEHEAPSWLADVVDWTPDQEDASTALATAPGYGASATDWSPVQVDGGVATFTRPLVGVAVEQNPPQGDAATAHHVPQAHRGLPHGGPRGAVTVHGGLRSGPTVGGGLGINVTKAGQLKTDTGQEEA